MTSEFVRGDKLCEFVRGDCLGVKVFGVKVVNSSSWNMATCAIFVEVVRQCFDCSCVCVWGWGGGGGD